ncbi:hypothetical protein, partial [Enterobacter hormaechei]|uniref:hypothetical protein n=3 Tax=Enterobacter hormaechei TaxID=158836 RepID=UPI00265BADB5
FSRLEYLPVTQGVAGSSPVRSATIQAHVTCNVGLFVFPLSHVFLNFCSGTSAENHIYTILFFVFNQF